MRLLVAEFCSLANQNYAFLSVLRYTQAVVVARAEIPEGLRVVGSRRFFEPLYPLLVVNPNTDAAYAETADSLAGQSYVNVFAVKPENAEADFVKALESCVYTQKVYDLIVERGFVPTFTVEAAE